MILPYIHGGTRRAHHPEWWVSITNGVPVMTPWQREDAQFTCTNITEAAHMLGALWDVYTGHCPPSRYARIIVDSPYWKMVQGLKDI